MERSGSLFIGTGIDGVLTVIDFGEDNDSEVPTLANNSLIMVTVDQSPLPALALAYAYVSFPTYIS